MYEGCDERLPSESHAGRSIVREHFGHHVPAQVGIRETLIADPPVQKVSGSGSDLKHRSGIEGSNGKAT